jgi:hypothetical protein
VFWLADGHYRLSAIREALSTDSPRVVRAEVREGSKRDAIFCAAGANGAHGTQLTKQEMRRVIERLLRDPAWGKMSARVIARHTGASNGYVSGIRKELKSQNASVYGTQIAPESSTVIVQRGEQEYPMKADNIGHRRSKKAETDTTDTPPASPGVPQVEPITDEDEEHTTEIGDGSGSVPAPAITPATIAVTYHDASSQSLSATEEDDLAKAWLAAPYAERKDFLQWVVTRSVAELGVDSNPEGFEHIGDVVVEMFKKS